MTNTPGGLAVDTISTIMKLAELGLALDDSSIAAAILKDILRTVEKAKEEGLSV